MKLSCDLSPLKGAKCPYYDKQTHGDNYPCDIFICPLEAVYETEDEEEMRVVRDAVLREYEGKEVTK